MPISFLTARWSNLVLATYAVAPEVLEHRLAPGVQLDLRGGQAFVSLVAFDFLDTRVLGVPWPGYRNFPEINLRFYVRHGAERGVMFIREFVPRRLVAWMARGLYNEPYCATPMQSTLWEDGSTISVEHRIRWKGRWHSLHATGDKPAFTPAPDSTEQFFKEHQWGFGRSRSGRLLRYEVRHPVWEVFPVRSFKLDLDWAAVYGPEWKILQDANPHSLVLAAGSRVAVYPYGLQPVTMPRLGSEAVCPR